MPSEFLGYVLALAVVAYALSQVMAGFRRAGDADFGQRHCMTCGAEGEPVRVTRGSFGVELVLWLCFIVPGLLYSLWRVSGRHDACAKCGSTVLVPPTSPASVAHKRQLQQ